MHYKRLQIEIKKKLINFDWNDKQRFSGGLTHIHEWRIFVFSAEVTLTQIAERIRSKKLYISIAIIASCVFEILIKYYADCTLVRRRIIVRAAMLM